MFTHHTTKAAPSLSKDELFDLMMEAADESGTLVTDELERKNRELVDIIFAMANVEDEIHVTQYNEFSVQARDYLIARDEGRLN